MEENYQVQYLKYLVEQGAHKIYGDDVPQEVWDRIELEYGVIIPNNFTDYILMIWDIYNFCKTPERVREFCKQQSITAPPDGIIPLGPGRGSVGGSMVCYCIGIHKCDPLLFGLYFERFLNPERIAYPDIDWDVSQKYRPIAISYIAEKYGRDKVAQIITYGTLSVRTVINEVLKAAQVPHTMIEEVKRTIPEEPTITLADVENDEKFLHAMHSLVFQDTQITVDKTNVQRILELNLYRRGIQEDDIHYQNLMKVWTGAMPSYTMLVKSTWNWEKALHIMKRLEGLNKNESTHAAGVVVAPVELEPNVPLLKKDGTGVLACQYDMRSLESLGYLKMDALGLRTVDVNHDAEALVRKWYDPDFDLDKIRYDDAETINIINAGDTVGIFQIESSGFTTMMQQLDIGGYELPRYSDRNDDLLSTIEKLRGLEIKDFMWISAGIAMYRPGPLDAVIEGKTMVQHLIDRKTGKEPVVYLFPEEKGYLEETYGVLVYQEQVMSRVRQMTGCSMGRADILRKAMGKKDPVLMKEQMDWFDNAAMGCEFSAAIKDSNHKRAMVDRAKEEIEKFARYGFNKAHTVEYAHICYHNAYLKAHYPTAFYTAILNSETDDPKRQTILIRDMLKHDIKLLPPTINASEAEFTMTDVDTIRFGLRAIKNIGGRAVDSIFNDRNQRGAYKSVAEFRARVPSTDCTVTGMTNLAKCGAFDELLGDEFDCRATLVESMKPMCDAIGKIKRKKPKAVAAPTVDEILMKLPNVAYPITKAEHDPIQYSVWEKEILKYYISAHPIDAYEDEIRRWTAVSDTEIEDLPDEFYIGGFIEGCHETVIKKEGRNKGKKMGFVTIGTAFRTYEATMFPGVYESCLPYIKDGEPVVLKGKKSFYKEAYSIQAIYIRSMTNSGIRDCPECHIRLNDPTYGQLATLKSMFDEHPGTTKVFINTINGYNDFSIECGQFVALNDHIIDYVESIGTLSYKPN